METYAVQLVQRHYPDLSAAFIKHRLHYSTFVNMDRSYLYYEVPKAGCTSMKTLIHRLEKLPDIPPLAGGHKETKREMFIHERGLFEMPSLVSLNSSEQEFVLNSPTVFRFAIVRNPYTRLLSAWRDKVRLCAPGYEHITVRLKGRLPKGNDPSSFLSFLEFVQMIQHEQSRHADHHWNLQAEHLFSRAFDFTHIGHLEEFSRAVQIFLSHAGYDEIIHDSGGMNESTSLDGYTQEMADIVYEKYHLDFTTYGYDRASWPRQKQDAGSVTVEKLAEEILERNLIIGMLYQERDRALRQTDTTVGKLSAVPTDDVERVFEEYNREEFQTLYADLIDPIEGWLSKDEAHQLYDLARNLTAGTIVEIGSYRGRSTAALALGSIAGARLPVYAIDPHEPFTGPFGGKFGPEDRGRFMQNLLRTGLYRQIRLVNLPSEALKANFLPQPVSLLWIDGDHRYESVIRDLRHWEPVLAPDAVLVLDDAATPAYGPGRLAAELLASGGYVLLRSVGKTMTLKRTVKTES